jgi:MerR family transcriptional regulator, light-induced transcriptional regulator
MADLIGVSESSVKRWVDSGHIPVIRTAGGHRRILLAEAVRFVRNQGMSILRPDLLGIPEPEPGDLAPDGLSGDILFRLLVAGDSTRVRAVLASDYVAGGSPAQLFDGPIAEALDRFGEMWKHGEEGIFREHVATSILIEALSQIRSLVPPPLPSSPRAVGGSPEGDPYLLPSLMAATTLADAGFFDVNLGANTPVGAFVRAVDAHQPEVVWIAATSHEPLVDMDGGLRSLVETLLGRGIAVVMGGRSAPVPADDWPDGVRVLASMTELDALARDLLALRER